MKIKQIILLIALTPLIDEVLSATDKVICYYANWGAQKTGNEKFGPEDINPNLCTHLIYAFAGLNEDGRIVVQNEETDINQEGFKKINDLKKINPKLKTLLSIGGSTGRFWTFESVASDPIKIANLAHSCIEYFELYGFDGLDIDWEFPLNTQTYVTLLKSLKNIFEPGGYLLTAAVYHIPGEIIFGVGYDVPEMSRYLDIINVMTYDFHAFRLGYTAENSPLYGGVNESKWNQDNRNADASIKYWLNAGASPEQIAIGIPFYGRTYTLSDPSQHGLGDPSSGPGEPETLGYNKICELYSNGTSVFLDDMKVPYLYDEEFWIGYENEQSVVKKVEYAKEKKLAGVFIWHIGIDDMQGFCGDENGLLNAINVAIAH